jgi:hypothetical protein
MVEEVKKEGEAFYICEERGFTYREKTWAEKCERFCSKRHACSLEITGHAVKIGTLNPRKQNFY